MADREALTNRSDMSQHEDHLPKNTVDPSNNTTFVVLNEEKG